jgi:uncharacterized protein (DUF736 family)
MDPKNNTGALFKNDKKATENHPDYTGKAIIEGQLYNLAAWVKTSKTGTKYMSLSFNIWQLKAETFAAPAPAPAPIVSPEDDMPF